MNSRIPLTVAVVGALLIGGATTGTTRASWTSQAPLHSSGVTAGRMAFTSAASPTSLTLNRAATGSVDVTITDTSLGKNMLQRVTPTVAANVGTAVLRSKTSSCTSTPQPVVNLTPGGAFTTCVNYTAPDTSATGATITVTINGAQMQGGSPAGWTFGPQIVTIPVTIVQPSTLAAPTGLTCTGGSGTSVLNWTAVNGATGYQIYRADNHALVRTVSSATSGDFVEANMGSPTTSSQKYSLYVKATNSTSTSVASSNYIIQFKPNGGCAG